MLGPYPGSEEPYEIDLAEWGDLKHHEDWGLFEECLKNPHISIHPLEQSGLKADIKQKAKAKAKPSPLGW